MGSSHPDEMLVVLGFRVEISGAGGTDVDTAWETCTGGALVLSEPQQTLPDKAKPKPNPKSVSEIVLRCPMTDSPARKAVMDWINKTARGERDRRTLSIIEINKDGSDGRRFNYLDCFPTRYVFPALSAAGTGNLYEEVHIKPIRLELA